MKPFVLVVKKYVNLRLTSPGGVAEEADENTGPPTLKQIKLYLKKERGVSKVDLDLITEDNVAEKFMENIGA